MLWWTLRQLNSPDPAKRERAIATLQPEMSDPRVRSALVRTLAGDADSAVCAAAAGALGEFGGNEAIAALIGKLENSTRPVASAVCAALVRIGAPAVQAVGRSLLEAGVAAADSVRVLEAIGGESAVTCLLAALANGRVEVIDSLGA